MPVSIPASHYIIHLTAIKPTQNIAQPESHITPVGFSPTE
jgi:hypothetical protein